MGTIAQYLTLVGLVHGLATHAVLASTIGYVIGAFVNYYLNFYYTFKSNKKHNEALPKFMIVAIIGLFLNTGMMTLFHDYMHIHYLLAQIFATGFILLWTFGANRAWSFREKHISIGRED